ncbi:pirin family protein [Asticcacaulis sp. SL142]|uniref:pirin family protein n=1 Tax=Asticcacaulis sp. SL142 TaxID=2995155 RepID=UPI00226C712E|nr:pirin family protein [Asticcacaulis sp. SL142]WAC48543.1 pirin family protein [Asticcacaulis sp. SL142]
MSAEDSGATDSVIDLIVPPRAKDLGGFQVRRLLPFARRRMVGPWIFFDHMGTVDFAPGAGSNVRPHPHINLATVTYLFEGAILHRDSVGSVATIVPGDINLMVAGRGIVHSEREVPETLDQPRRMHGLQLWLALPEADEEIDPVFFHYDSAVLPKTEVTSVPVRVMMGQAFGVTSPVKTYSPTLYAEAALTAGQTLDLPEGVDEMAVYVAAGVVSVDGVPVDEFHMAILKRGTTATLTATTDARIAIIGGEGMAERHIYWNFISSRPERIEQAKADWKAGRFPKVPGDDIEFIPLPE